MSNELTRYAATAITKSDDSISRSAGKGLMTVGAGGIGLWFLAGMLPFITFPMLLIAAVIGGVLLYAK